MSTCCYSNSELEGLVAVPASSMLHQLYMTTRPHATKIFPSAIALSSRDLDLNLNLDLA